VLWIAQFFSTACGGIQGSINKESKDPRIQDLKGRLLRHEARRGTEEVVGNVEPASAELDLAVVEDEERRAREPVIVVGIVVLVPSAVDPEIVVVLEPLGVRQEHDPHGERAETELAGVEHLTRPTDGPAPMTETELCRNDEDVVLRLLVAQLLEHRHRALALTETVRTQVALAVVVELAVAGLADEREDLFDRRVVRRCDLVPARDGEPSLGVRRKLAVDDLHVGGAEPGEQLTETSDLVGDTLGLVARQVAVLRFDLFVGELVGHGELADSGDDPGLELVAVLDERLEAVLVEADFLQRALRGVFDEPQILLLLTISDGRDRLCRHRHSSCS